MQAGMFVAVLFTTAYAPQDLLTGWLHDVAKYNPVTQVLEAVRQGFIGDVTWADTWPGLVAVAGIGVVTVSLAMRGLRRTGR
jgi:ABC-type polysaccharide/polyol phosphate export permease